QRRPGLPGRHRPLRLPQLLSRGHVDQPEAVSGPARPPPRVPRARGRHDRGAGTPHESGPAKPRLTGGDMDFSPPRGTQDFLPPAGERLRALYERAARLARLHGFRYVETPAIESTDLFR